MGMKKYIIFFSAFGFAVSALPASAAVGYFRSPSGPTVSSPVAITVSIGDWQNDINAPRERNLQPDANYWWITIDKVNSPQSSADEIFSECLPSSALSHTFTFSLAAQAYYAVNLWSDNENTCLQSVENAFNSDPYAVNTLLDGDNSIAAVPTFTVVNGNGDLPNIYTFEGFLPPIKADGGGIYKAGKALPVKFQLTDQYGNFVSDALARISLLKISDGIIGSEEVPFSSSAADTGDKFRYDFDGNQYVYNLDTSLLDRGLWLLRVALDDGTRHEVNISIR